MATITQSYSPTTGITPGTALIYTIIINGMSLFGSTVTDTNLLPGHFTSVTSSSGTPSFSGNQFTFTDAAFGSSSVTLTATYVVDGNAPLGTYGNTVVVDPNLGSTTTNTKYVTLVPGNTTLVSTLTTDRFDYRVKTAVIYKATVANTGLYTASNVILNFTTTAEGPLFANSDDVPNPYIHNLGNIAAGQNVTQVIQQAVPTGQMFGPPATPGTYTAQITADGDNASPVQANATFRFLNVTVQVIVSDDTVVPGQTITYDIEMVNLSEVDMSGCLINDTTTAPGVFNSVTGEDGIVITNLVIGSAGFVATLGSIPAITGTPHPKLVASFTVDNSISPGTYTNTAVLSCTTQPDTVSTKVITV